MVTEIEQIQNRNPQFQESGTDITELILQEFTFHLQKALLNLGKECYDSDEHNCELSTCVAYILFSVPLFFHPQQRLQIIKKIDF